jgi:hypothetical protein
MDHLKLVAKARLFSQIEVRNIFYLEVAAMPTPAELLTDMPGYLTGFYTPMLGTISTVFLLYGWDVHTWDAVTHTWNFTIAGSISLAGTNAADPLPTQMAGVLVAYTLTKRVFARKFIAGLVDDAVVGNAMVPACLLALTNTLIFWMTNYTGPSAKIYEPVTLTKALTFVTFSQAVVDRIFGTMRRRKAGVGI